MSGIGSGYDLSVTTFSQDGRLYQIEYAEKCISSSSPVLGIICKDGILLAANIWRQSKLLLPGSGNRLFKISDNVICGVVGMRSDGLKLVDRARLECLHYFDMWGSNIPGKILALNFSQYLHAYTCYWPYRPMGAYTIFGVFEEPENPTFPGSTVVNSAKSAYIKKNENTNATDKRFSIYIVDTSGSITSVYGTALGHESDLTVTSLENCDRQNMTIDDMKKYIAKVLVKQHLDNDSKKDFELEFLSINDQTISKASHSEVEQLKANATSQYHYENTL